MVAVYEQGSDRGDSAECHKPEDIYFLTHKGWHDFLKSHEFLELLIKCTSKEYRLQTYVSFMQMFQNSHSGHKV